MITARDRPPEEAAEIIHRRGYSTYDDLVHRDAEDVVVRVDPEPFGGEDLLDAFGDCGVLGGGTAVQQATGHEDSVEEMAKYLSERKDGLYKLSAATGATRSSRSPCSSALRRPARSIAWGSRGSASTSSTRA